MAIVINGSGTVTGLAVGGLPDGTVDAGTLATNSVDSAELIDGAVDDSHMAAMAASKLTGALPAIDGASLTGIKGAAFNAKAGSTLGLSNITWTKVPLNTENYDSDGCFDNATNYRFTPTTAGYYKIFASIRVTAGAVRALQVGLYKNGSWIQGNYSDFGGTTTIGHLSKTFSAILPFNGSSDYIELYVWAQFNSASLTIQNGEDTSMSGHWIRSL